MSWAAALTAGVDLLQPHVVGVALVSARLLPVAFLCPLFGGTHAPTHVKLGLVFSLACFLHVEGAVIAPAAATASAFEFSALALHELAFGTTLGLVASLPFDAARIGGRFIDLFRGSSAEAALPMSGTKEAATGDALYHLLLALACTGPIFPLVLTSLGRSFRLVPLGGFHHTEAVALTIATLVAGAFSTGLALAAPIAGLSLTVDAVLALASRASTGTNLQDLGAPLRILAGGAAVWTVLGLIALRIQTFALGTGDALRLVMEAGQ